MAEDVVDKLEHLLHDGVLSRVVAILDELLVALTVTSLATVYIDTDCRENREKQTER